MVKCHLVDDLVHAGFHSRKESFEGIRKALAFQGEKCIERRSER